MSPKLHFTWTGGWQLRTCIMLADTKAGSCTSFSNRVYSHHTWSAAARQFHRVMSYVIHAYPLCLRTCMFSVRVPLCVYTYTAVHIHQQPFVCVCNVKRLCVYVHGRAWCIVHVNESNNWLRRFCIQGMWGTILGFFKCLIVLKLKKKITHV